MVSVGIIGGAGFTGGELIRILQHHPKVEIVSVSSSSQAGKNIGEVHQDLVGQTKLTFTDTYVTDLDVVFICLPHGQSKDFQAKITFPATTKIIDLSNDFRLQFEGNTFIYGLPELNRNKIKPAGKIANPGCFATAIQLALLPLAQAKLLNSEIHISAITGSTGAGIKPLPTTHFTWRNNNMSVYKAFKHQHLDEIAQSLNQLNPDFNQAINFIPYRGDFTRGIIATVYLNYNDSEEAAKLLYKEFYDDELFVHISDQNVHLKQVVNTNNNLLYLQKHGDKLMIVSVIDNLIKGASGQAVQNLNLMFGWDEDLALNLKASVF